MGDSINNIISILGEPFDQWYGVINDQSLASPDMQRTGIMSLHASLPVHEACKPCILKDDGTVNYYVQKTDVRKKLDGSAADSTGADGQCMTEIGPYWRLPDNPLGIHAVSPVPKPGWQYVPKFYMGRYEASEQRSTSKLCSVVNNTADFRGGNNTSAWDAAPQSLLGKPVTTITLPDARTYARNRGSIHWNLTPYQMDMLFYELYMIEFATKHSQKTVNTSLISLGFKQGGLGNGITTVNGTEWNTFNSRNPFCPCGITDTLVNHWGEVSFTVTDLGGAGVNRTLTANRYLWCENPFGHIHKWKDGASVYHEAAGGNSKLYVCNNPINFADGTSTGYDYIGNLPITSGYINMMGKDNRCIMYPSGVNGSNATYYCDYYYTPGLINSWTILYGGGAASFGLNAGFNILNTYSVVSSISNSIGARLCYIP